MSLGKSGECLQVKFYASLLAGKYDDDDDELDASKVHGFIWK